MQRVDHCSDDHNNEPLMRLIDDDVMPAPIAKQLSASGAQGV